MPQKPPVFGAAERRARRADYFCFHDGQRGSPSQRGYGRRWQRLRKVVLARDDYRCVRCGECVGASGPVDHIVPKARGGTDDLENLETLCVSCHSRKTVVEDGGFKRLTGVGPETPQGGVL